MESFIDKFRDELLNGEVLNTGMEASVVYELGGGNITNIGLIALLRI